MTNMLYSGHLVIAGTILRLGELRPNSFVFSGQLIAGIHCNGHIFPRLAQNQCLQRTFRKFNLFKTIIENNDQSIQNTTEMIRKIAGEK